jgi:hypothetical protein
MLSMRKQEQQLNYTPKIKTKQKRKQEITESEK